MARWPRLLGIVVLGACGRDERAPPVASPQAVPPTAATESSAPASASGSVAATSESIVPARIRTAICNAEPCGGDEPVIRVYRDASGRVTRLYRLYGSCFHSPGIFFSPDGKQLEEIPERPVMRGSKEAEESAARLDRHLGGTTHTDTIRCRDGLRLPDKK